MNGYRCLVCGSQKIKPLPRAAFYVNKPPHIMIYQCYTCGCKFSPDPGDAYDVAYYDSYDDFTPGTVAYNERIMLFRQRSEMLVKQVGVGNILDIGCARGDFLDQAAVFGFITYGLEVSTDAAQVAIRRGHRVENALAEKLPFADKTFVAVHMNHVLEHVFDPLANLQEIHRVLKPEGLAIIEIPNEFGPLAVRLKLMMGRLGKPGTPQLRYAPHVIYFNMHSLSRVLRQAGFKVVARDLRFAGGIIPSLTTVPAMLARIVDRMTNNGDEISVVISRQ